jgi:hypothetical protein
MYNNVGGGGGGRLTTMPNVQASNPYKVMKDGAFRPPMYTQSELLPLSRQRRSETSGITNPGVRSGFNIPNLVDNIDKTEIVGAIGVNKINYLSIRPTASYKIQLPQEVFVDNAITERPQLSADPVASFRVETTQPTYVDNAITDSNYTSAGTGVKGYAQNAKWSGDNPYEASRERLNYGAGTNLSVLVYNPATGEYTEVQGTTRDKINIAVQSKLNQPISLVRDDGTRIRVKEYTWKTVQSAAGRDSLVLQIADNPDIELTRNTPLYAVGSSASGISRDERMNVVDPIMKEMLSTGAGSGVAMNTGRRDAIHDVDYKVQLRGMGSIGTGISNIGSIPTMGGERSLPTLESKRMGQAISDRYNVY